MLHFKLLFQSFEIITKYARLKNARDKNVKTFSTFARQFTIFVNRRKKSCIDEMKTVTSEDCNTHTLYH